MCARVRAGFFFLSVCMCAGLEMCAWVCAGVCTCVCTHMCACVDACMCTCVCGLCTRTCVCTHCVCACVFVRGCGCVGNKSKRKNEKHTQRMTAAAKEKF